MERLEQELVALLALRPGCAALANLALDCWKAGVARGEEEGLKWAAMVRAGVTAYERHRAHRAALGAWHRERGV